MDRLWTCYPKPFHMVAATVQPGIADPPLPNPSSGTFMGQCKCGLSVKEVNEC